MAHEIIKRSFFGKGTCFKFVLYEDSTAMFHFGVEKEQWQWKKVKMNDAELGDILLVLEGRTPECSFYHTFGEGKEKTSTQIWANRKDGNTFFIRVKELSKSFTTGEQRVLQALLSHAMLRMNLQL